jgi:hypothetical protein
LDVAGCGQPLLHKSWLDSLRPPAATQVKKRSNKTQAAAGHARPRASNDAKDQRKNYSGPPQGVSAKRRFVCACAKFGAVFARLFATLYGANCAASIPDESLLKKIIPDELNFQAMRY